MWNPTWRGVSLTRFRTSRNRDNYIKHHCKGRLLQSHPEAIWTCKSVCKVRRDVCRKLNNKSVISFTQILFIMPVLKLSRRTVYNAQTASYGVWTSDQNWAAWYHVRRSEWISNVNCRIKLSPLCCTSRCDKIYKLDLYLNKFQPQLNFLLRV